MGRRRAPSPFACPRQLAWAEPGGARTHHGLPDSFVGASLRGGGSPAPGPWGSASRSAGAPLGHGDAAASGRAAGPSGVGRGRSAEPGAPNQAKNRFARNAGFSTTK
jgi:hypothetical protein